MAGRWFTIGFVVPVAASLWPGLSRRRVAASRAGRGLLAVVNVGLAIAAVPVVTHILQASFPTNVSAELYATVPRHGLL